MIEIGQHPQAEGFRKFRAAAKWTFLTVNPRQFLANERARGLPGGRSNFFHCWHKGC